jgi:hypothetical protein
MSKIYHQRLTALFSLGVYLVQLDRENMMLSNARLIIVTFQGRHLACHINPHL